MICMFKAIHYCQLMNLKTFEIFVLKYMGLILLINLLTKIRTKVPKSTKVKLGLSTDI